MIPSQGVHSLVTFCFPNFPTRGPSPFTSILTHHHHIWNSLNTAKGDVCPVFPAVCCSVFLVRWVYVEKLVQKSVTFILTWSVYLGGQAFCWIERICVPCFLWKERLGINISCPLSLMILTTYEAYAESASGEWIGMFPQPPSLNRSLPERWWAGMTRDSVATFSHYTTFPLQIAGMPLGKVEKEMLWVRNKEAESLKYFQILDLSFDNIFQFLK